MLGCQARAPANPLVVDHFNSQHPRVPKRVDSIPMHSTITVDDSTWTASRTYATMRRQIQGINFFWIIFHDVDSASWHFWAHADGKPSVLNEYRAEIKVAGGPGRQIEQKCDIVPLDFGFGQVVSLSLGVIVPDSVMRHQILLSWLLPKGQRMWN